MSRVQNISQQPDTLALPALLAAGTDLPLWRQPKEVPFTKAELRHMILEIMG